MSEKDDKTFSAELAAVGNDTTVVPADAAPRAAHCWHSPEVVETFTNSYEQSTKVMCCWCGARAYEKTRSLGRDRVENHGPYYERRREVTVYQIVYGTEQCPRKPQLISEAP